MLVIFGTKPVGTTIQQGSFSCPNCRTERNYLLKRYKNYFTLFFIPLIPMKDLGDSAECLVCRKSYVPGSVLSTYDGTPQSQDFQPDSQTTVVANAAPGKRFGAYFIDMIILTILNFPTAFLIPVLPTGLQQFLQHRFYIVILLLWFLYFFLFEYFAKGYTIGKKIFSIQTTSNGDGHNLSISQALVRSLIKMIPVIPVVLLFTKDNRAVHDYAANSIVVQK
ncbi:RDD family protein [Pedobacter caeni]|uniref:Uncharacterized membrane protein YckC, RDD family n=1 Tax=Pedobacter caeni TaxID=288992 RepID=A0A1M5F188_9SPHI|nr:RDD family protein [Pedobacter caeni]SHF85226.1 Uncharacterized membrane protein YckC, RDD family [Pedobacter caeni]